ncbi:MAG TPA: hypothetical protein VEP90_06975, partial [Methylomirabilota bacterium]|nr:hypothetical protein [Methylomirabilota bacterium]
EELINHLWKLGLLRADLIVSSQEVDETGLIFVGQEEDIFVYADARLPQPYQDTSSVSLEEAQAISPALQIYFHPFRFTVLQCFELLVPSIAPIQLLYPQQYRSQEMMAVWLNMFQPAQSNFQRTQIWNDIASLLVATEPCFYERIFQHIHGSLFQSRPIPRQWSQEGETGTIGNAVFKALRAEIKQHWIEVANHYRTLEVNRLKQLHQDLIHQAKMLDKNTDVHTILRLGNRKLRLELEGQLGGAMLLLTMAEVLRRATEEVFSIQLQEEDQWHDEAKGKLFGSKRLLDGDRNAANELLRQRGLSYAPRLRWYVEGDTEFCGLIDFFKAIGATDIEILNLRGHIVQKNKIAFRESLRSDLRMGIFSFVSLDKDVDTNFKTLRAAVQQNQICGSFFISDPDFEFANFDLSELQEIVWDIALERGADTTKKSIFLAATSATDSGRKFEQKVKQASSDIPELWNIAKGEEWGKRLMQYALSHPDRLNGVVRLCIKAIRLAMNSRSASYNYTRIHFRVDPETGESIKSDTPMTSQERLKEI